VGIASSSLCQRFKLSEDKTEHIQHDKALDIIWPSFLPPCNETHGFGFIIAWFFDSMSQPPQQQDQQHRLQQKMYQVQEQQHQRQVICPLLLSRWIMHNTWLNFSRQSHRLSYDSKEKR
jgi:hypothetical protein